MDCSLWFGRCMVNSASEIAEHFDMASLRGYFLGGSLEEWLREHGGEEQADRVSALDPKDPALDRRLAEIFGQADAEKNEVFRGDGAGYAAPAVSGSGWNRGSYSVGSGAAGYGSYFTGGSYAVGYGSYGSAVGSFGGFRLWEWEWEWRFGSFAGSFRNSSWRGGSFAGGSFLGGSFGFGSLSGWLGSFAGSFGWGSFAFPMANGSCFITADEYDRIMYLTLRRCPLDCFGYGIHIV